MLKWKIWDSVYLNGQRNKNHLYINILFIHDEKYQIFIINQLYMFVWLTLCVFSALNLHHSENYFHINCVDQGDLSHKFCNQLQTVLISILNPVQQESVVEI